MGYPRHIQRLAELFSDLPGIGPRQALRIAYAVLEKDELYREELIRYIHTLGMEVGVCAVCFRKTEKGADDLCGICRNPNRDVSKIMVVEKDADMETVEKSNTYNGVYHITGGVISAMEKQPGEKLRLRELFSRISSSKDKHPLEVIIATSNTFEGNQTGAYIEKIIQPLGIKITRLGRGLSMGAEIEYADPLTLEAAFKNRK